MLKIRTMNPSRVRIHSLQFTQLYSIFYVSNVGLTTKDIRRELEDEERKEPSTSEPAMDKMHESKFLAAGIELENDQ